MASILSFLRKDLRLLRWPWLAWLGLLIAKIALGFWCIRKTHFSGADNGNAQRVNLALTALGALTCYLLILRLVQADAPLRPRAFWRTRPISGGGLLVAKALTAFLLFGLAPVLVSFPWWLSNGLGGADLALAALEVLLAHAALILPAFLIASVVDTFGRAVLWSIVQYGAVVGLALFAGPSEDTLSLLEPGLALSRELLAAGLAALGLVALVVWQFRRRRQVAVIAGFVLLHLIVGVVWRYSPYNFIPRPAGWTELNAERYKNVTLQPTITAHYDHPKYRGPQPAPAFVRLRWPVAGLPPDLVASSWLTSFSYTTAQDESITPNDAFPYVWPGFHSSAQATRNLLGLPRINTPDDETQTTSINIYHQLTLDQAGQIKRQPPATTTTLRLGLYRPEIQQNHPLSPGLAVTDRHGSLRIVRLDPTRFGVEIECSRTEPSSLLRLYATSRRTHHQAPQSDSLVERPQAQDLLFNTETPEIQRDLMGWNSKLRIHGVEISRLVQGCAPLHLRHEGPLPSETYIATWRAGLRVARITYRVEARFLLSGRSGPLVITGSPEAPPAKH